MGDSESVKILGVKGVLCMWHLVFALRHRLIHQEQQEQQHAKRVPDGHGRSFGSWPWQKQEQNWYALLFCCVVLFRKEGELLLLWNMCLTNLLQEKGCDLSDKVFTLHPAVLLLPHHAIILFLHNEEFTFSLTSIRTTGLFRPQLQPARRHLTKWTNGP